MKIGIISMQRIVNYGSFMQALSLKQILESLGHEVVFTDYKPNVPVNSRKDRKKKIALCKKRLIDHIKSGLLQTGAKQFLTVQVTEKERLFYACYPLLGLRAARRYYRKTDALVVGSDEVFNCLQMNMNVGYCLDFFGYRCRAPKIISYAASFGSTTLSALQQYGVAEEIGKYLGNFSALSVRDQNSQDIVSALCGRDAVCNLDPVLVGDLETQTWKPIREENFIIVYGYANRFSEAEAAEIRNFARSKGMQTIALCDELPFCDKQVVCPPDEVLSYFAKAAYVITDTFHGAIFSMIYHKPFAAFVRQKCALQSTNAEKLTDLLQRVEMESRVVGDLSDLPTILEEEIRYRSFDEIRAHEKAKARSYLRQALTEDAGWGDGKGTDESSQ